jgi:hypothetical protein
MDEEVMFWPNTDVLGVVVEGVTVVLIVCGIAVVLLCKQTVHGMVRVVAAQVGQGIITVVVIGVTTAFEELLTAAGAGAGVVDVIDGYGRDCVGDWVLVGATEVLLIDAGLKGVDFGGQLWLLTPVEGFFDGMPGILRSLPIHNLSQSVPGFAFWRSSNLMPKLSAML